MAPSGRHVPAEGLRRCRSAVCKTDQTRSRSAMRGWARGTIHPRPTYGICVAMTVIVCTLADSGRPAM